MAVRRKAGYLLAPIAASVLTLSSCGSASQEQAAQVDRKAQSSAYFVVLESLKTATGRDGKIVTIGEFGVKKTLFGVPRERLRIVRPGDAPANAKVGDTGWIKADSALLAKLFDDRKGGGNRDAPKPYSGIAVWLWSGVAHAPTTPPTGTDPPGKPPGKPPGETPPTNTPPADEYPSDPDTPAPIPWSPGGPGRDTDDGDGIDDGQEFAEFLCGGEFDTQQEEDDCIMDMMDVDTTLQGSPSDPEDGGYTGGRNGGDTGESGL